MNSSTDPKPLYLPFILACLLAYCIGLPGAAAQTVADNLRSNHELSAEQIGAGRKAAESDSTLDEPQKQKTLELYDQALKWLQQTTETQAQLAQLEALVSQAPQRIEAIRAGKAQSVREMHDTEAVLASGNLEQIELALNQEQLALQLARENKSKQTDELTRLLVGSKGLSEEISALMKTLEQIDADLQAPATNEPSALLQARILVLRARRMLRQTEIRLLKQRLGSHDLLTNLAQAERDLAASETTERQTRFELLSQAAQRLREGRAREARQQADDLKSRTDTLPKTLQIIAQENAHYHLELEELVGHERLVSTDLQTARLGLDGIKSDFERTRQRVDVVGASEAIGKMLRRRYAELPSSQRYRRDALNGGEEISRATDRQIEIDELLREQGDFHTVVARTLEGLPEEERAHYQQQTTELARARRDALNELQKVYGRYIGHITSLDLAERQLVEVAAAYVDYIDDQLIWVPGPSISALMNPATLGQALAWLLAPGNWTGLAQDAWTLAQQHPGRCFLILALFSLLLKKRKGAWEQLRVIARETRMIRSDSFRLTLAALLHTLVIISPWPLLLIGTGWLLGTLPTASPFTLAMANGLVKAGMILFSIGFLIQVCMPDGVGDRHLRWLQPVREEVAKKLGWILPVAVPLGFLVAVTAGNEPPQAAQALGQLAFTVFMAVSALFVFRLLRKDGILMQGVIQSNADSILAQLHFIWFPLLAILPLAFAATSALGYHYTALHLEQRAEQTFWFFIGLFLLKELLLRSLYIAERRLRLEDAVRRRDELRAQRALDAESREEAAPVFLDIPELDFVELSEQNKRLVRAGFLFGAVIGIWSIWTDLLPALGFLNSTELPFHATRIVDGIAKEVPVTLGNLIVGLAMVLVTILASKNIPGVLEIALLQRLPLDPGARYAITNLSQYAIAGIGVSVAFSTLGLQWSSIQWLVAALSVGLGFGLQEIVANFISGIILLFERPIRVGDVVTLDNTTGKVSRIRIRATTITNWDKQELLIPNKEFITGRVINWTLTDKTNRIVITVGVAYGTDVKKAMDLMLEAALENQEILEDPKPVTSFESFGDNALTLVLRSYLGSMDNRLATITALHQSINDKFAASGISIAFPQRDIHLSTDEPLDVRMHSAPPKGTQII